MCVNILRFLLVNVILFNYIFTANAKDNFRLNSPDNNISIDLEVRNNSVYYDLLVDGKKSLQKVSISMGFDDEKLNRLSVMKSKTTSTNQIIYPLISQKSSTITDHFNQLELDFKNGLKLQFRAYDNGIAWRWNANKKGKYKVLNESNEFEFSKDSYVWYSLEKDFYSMNEVEYAHLSIDETDGKLASLPILFESEDVKMLLMESDLIDYAGMWVQGKSGKIVSTFPNYPIETKRTSIMDEIVVSRENFIAEFTKPKTFPWRIIGIARTDAELITNQLVYQLASPHQGDYSWVKPGKSVWDWWSGYNIYNVDFKAGVNTKTLMYDVDFAAENNIEYVLVDAGWCDWDDFNLLNPEVDIPHVVKYAKSKKVGIILWGYWLPLSKHMIETLDRFQSWGVSGIKIDFMQRDDQVMTNFYTELAEEAAKRKLIIDYHGSTKPAGINRTYPNVLTLESVFGNEMNRFNNKVTTTHTVTIPFIRMQTGPMDFTPGSMQNTYAAEFRPTRKDPHTIGTRCNQMAMFIVYESPLQMICDSPTEYMKDENWMKFLRHVPTVWKNTYPIDGKIGEYIVLAREALNGDFHIGAMTNTNERKFSVPLSFLPNGNFKIEIWRDGINVSRQPKDYIYETILNVNKDTKLELNLAEEGGFVARISKY